MSRRQYKQTLWATFLLEIACAGATEKVDSSHAETRTASSPPTATSPSPTPLSQDAREIPKGFVFSTPKGLVERLSVTPRDEFESTTEFKARAAAKVDASLACLSMPDSLVYYDADVKAFIAYTYPMLIKGAMKGPYGVMLDEESTTGDNYEGENAMGAKVSVVREAKHIIGVGLRDDETTDIGYPELPLRSDSARTLKARIKAFIAISPRQGRDGNFVIEVADRTQPTISRRRDTHRRISTILASKIEIWFYDDSTRKVLRKVAAKVID